MIDPTKPIPFRSPSSALSAESTYEAIRQVIEHSGKPEQLPSQDVYQAIMSAQATIDGAYIQGWFTLAAGLLALFAAWVTYRVAIKQIGESQRQIQESKDALSKQTAHSIALELSHRVRLFRREFAEILGSKEESECVLSDPSKMAGIIANFPILGTPVYIASAANISTLFPCISAEIIPVYSSINEIEESVTSIKKWFRLGYYINTRAYSVSALDGMKTWRVTNENLEVNAVVTEAGGARSVLKVQLPSTIKRMDKLIDLICKHYRIDKIETGDRSLPVRD